MGRDIIIRRFNKNDREKVRSISCETAFLGRAREEFFDDDEILADGITLYYTDYEPDACFVALSGDEIIGYLTGSQDVNKMRRVFNRRIMPGLWGKALRKGVLRKRHTQRFIVNIIASFFKGEFWSPDFSKKYPATLHINIDKNFRGQGTGARLIENYLQFLREKGVSGVHFGTMSESAKAFFLKRGFNVLFTGKRSYLRYSVGKNSPYYMLGKLI